MTGRERCPRCAGALLDAPSAPGNRLWSLQAIEVLEPPPDVPKSTLRTDLHWCPRCQIGVRVWRRSADGRRVRSAVWVFGVAVLVVLVGLVALVVHWLSQLDGLSLPRN